ncbi:Hypothetical predicted protein, partial [Marmota monax]
MAAPHSFAGCRTPAEGAGGPLGAQKEIEDGGVEEPTHGLRTITKQHARQSETHPNLSAEAFSAGQAGVSEEQGVQQ